MRPKVTKRPKKKNRKKRKIRAYSKKKANGGAIDLQKIVNFKFQNLNKIYKDFSEEMKRIVQFVIDVQTGNVPEKIKAFLEMDSSPESIAQTFEIMGLY